MKKELLLSKPKINDNLQIKHEDVKRNLESSSNNRTISKQDKFRTNMNQIQSKNNKNMLIANGFNYKIFAKEEMQFNKSAEKIPKIKQKSQDNSFAFNKTMYNKNQTQFSRNIIDQIQQKVNLSLENNKANMNDNKKNRRVFGGSISNKMNKAKKIAIFNSSGEYVRPPNLINTQNNIIIISNNQSKYLRNRDVNRKIKEVQNIGMLMNQSKRKKKSEVQDYLKAPYLKLPGTNSMFEESLIYSSSRKQMRSDSKRKSGQRIGKY